MNLTEVLSPSTIIPTLSKPPSDIPLAKPLQDPISTPSTPPSGFTLILLEKSPFYTPLGAHTSSPTEHFPRKRDNLLVKADIFTILGVSFYVTQNAFNLIKIKK